MASKPTEQEWVRPQDYTIDTRVLELVPREVAEHWEVFPLELKENGGAGQATLVVAMGDADNLFVQDQLVSLTGCRIQVRRASPGDIRRAIIQHYDALEEQTIGGRLPAVDHPTAREEHTRLGGLAGIDEAPAVSAVNSIIEAAIAERASDIHIEPQSARLYVRFRIDGVMYDHQTLKMEVHPPIVSRIKILGRLNIAERRLPQDGRFDLRSKGKEYDVRVSIVPGTMGEKVVLRMLPKSASGLKLRELGLSPHNLDLVEELIGRPYGMLLATGPTGSGKTTTLYAALSKIDCTTRNVITIEDPVEYELPRVTQIQVHPKIGLTFAAGLRSILRQDPDVLMVGEIRDAETLDMTIQAALTGHLVFSTLHCNDAAGAVARMVDMGAEPFLVASSLSGLISQRLVRRICRECKTSYKPDKELLDQLKFEQPTEFYRGIGCSTCRGTGYWGRTSVFEVLDPDEDFHAAVVRKVPASDLRRIMREKGVSSLLDDGLFKAREGVTTIDEVLRAVYVEK